MKYLFALFLALASFGSAFADSREAVVTKVPFDFVVGNRTFPAGTYTIKRVADDPQGGLLIQSSDGKINAFFLPTTSGAAGSDDDAKLRFRHEGNEYFLTGISSGVEMYTVAPPRHHQTMPNPDEAVSTVGP